MGTLANLGILTENAPRRFALTPLGDALRIGAPGSVRATILTLANDWHWRGLKRLNAKGPRALGQAGLDFESRRARRVGLRKQDFPC
jgi:hypothetical protein